MTRDEDFIGQLEGYLDEYEGLTPLPDVLRDAIRAELPSTRQIGWLGPPMRRFNFMNNNIVRFGLAAAVVVLAAFIGIKLLGGPSVGGPGPSPSGSSAEPTPSEPAPSASIDTGFVLWNAPGEVAITVTLPASGWGGAEGGGILETAGKGADPPDGAGMIVFEGDLYVYGDPCHWSTTQPDAPATTVDELVAALSAQASRDATAPVDVTVGGYAGKSITLHVPDDAAFSAGNFTDCDQGNFGSWAAVTGTGGPDPTPSRYHQGPGQIDELWILDVNGVMVVFDTAYYAVTPSAVVEEITAIVESATFEMP